MGLSTQRMGSLDFSEKSRLSFPKCHLRRWVLFLTAQRNQLGELLHILMPGLHLRPIQSERLLGDGGDGGGWTQAQYPFLKLLR